MLEELSWRLRRYMHLGRRVLASVRLRGVASTWQRVVKAMLARRTPATDESNTPPVPAHSGHEPRMLVLDASAPDPTRDSGSLRMYSLLELLREQGWRIDFFADDGASTPADILRLSTIGVTFLPGNIVRWLRTEGPNIDTVVLSRAPIAHQYQPLVRKLSPRARIIFDTVDLHFLRERRGADLIGSTALRRQAEATLREELALIRSSDLSLVVSEEEQRMLAELAPECRVELLSNIHRVHGRGAGYEGRRDLLFVGGFSHPPNLDAMRWFISDVWPIVRGKQPGLELHVVGELTPQASAELRGEGVRLHGRVEDLTPVMNAARLSVAPLRFGAGVKGKVNMAMSHGLPVVLTPVAAEGMHLTDGEDALIAESAQDFAAAVLRAYHDPDLWLSLSNAGIRNIEQHFSFELARQQVRRLFAD